ncbi:MAG: hypothetical protein M1834_004690 [Cirrosporium novae-zelandiae]|nr:MAG: hypothetical protein M1834_004690 [Cirrosporium novae-zelandiae]
MASSLQLPKAMTAVQVTEFHKPYSLNTIPIPDPRNLGPHEILVKTATAGLCHTDFMVRDGVFGATLPRTASHEGAGTVVAIGSSIANLIPNDRVMIGIAKDACGHCASCTGPSEYTQYCPYASNIGVTVHGTFAEFVVCDGREATPIPPSIPFTTAAPLACAGKTVWRGIIDASLQPNQTLAIVGAGGGLGHLGIQFAHVQQLKVIAIDARDEGLELCREENAEIVLDARIEHSEIINQVEKATSGKRADATLNLSDADSAAGLAAAVTRMHGRLVQIAQPPRVSIPYAELIFRDVRVSGSLLCSREQARDMLDAVARYGIRAKTFLVEGLERVRELVEVAESGRLKGKGVVVVDGEQREIRGRI